MPGLTAAKRLLDGMRDELRAGRTGAALTELVAGVERATVDYTPGAPPPSPPPRSDHAPAAAPAITASATASSAQRRRPRGRAPRSPFDGPRACGPRTKMPLASMLEIAMRA